MIEQREWPHIDPLIIIRELQSRKHTLDKQRFPCPGISDHPDQQILR
jgi:hypothetical protein